jgi:hypothetical protein
VILADSSLTGLRGSADQAVLHGAVQALSFATGVIGAVVGVITGLGASGVALARDAGVTIGARIAIFARREVEHGLTAALDVIVAQAVGAWVFVGANGRVTVHASRLSAARLHPIARLQVVTQRVVGQVGHSGLLIAGVLSTEVSIVELEGRSGDTAFHQVADLRAITQNAVRAASVVGLVEHGVRGLITRVHGAIDAIVQLGNVIGDAALREIARLHTIAPEVIETQRVVGLMDHSGQLLVAGVDRTVEPVTEHGRLALDATRGEITELISGAEQSVIAHGVIRERCELLGLLIADRDHAVRDPRGLRRNAR